MACSRIPALERTRTEAKKVGKGRLDNSAVSHYDNRLLVKGLKQLRKLRLHPLGKLGYRFAARVKAIVPALCWREIPEALHEHIHSECFVAALPLAQLWYYL